MWTTDKHVFIHLNKAAGVFVKDWMIRYLSANLHRYKHAPIRMLNTKHRDKIKIGCIRDPFKWYESYYKYLTQQKRITDLSFRQFIETYTMHPRALFDFMGKKVRKKFENLYPPKTTLPIGTWTFHYINYFQFDARKTLAGNGDIVHNDLDFLMRTETLAEDMIKVFGEEYREVIKFYPMKNVSREQFNRWSPELIKLVELRDGVLMKELGYGNANQKVPDKTEHRKKRNESVPSDVSNRLPKRKGAKVGTQPHRNKRPAGPGSDTGGMEGAL